MSYTKAQQEVIDAVNEWMATLDNGDIEGLLATCADDVIVANESQPTTMGIEHMREKYATRMEMADFKSGFDVENIIVDEHFAVIVGAFDVEITDKSSKQSQVASGRVALAYRKDAHGAWKLVLDIDNNA